MSKTAAAVVGGLSLAFSVVLGAIGAGAPVVLAAPAAQSAQAGAAPEAGVSYVTQRPGSFLAAPVVSAYVHVFTAADAPVGRTAVQGLQAAAFSATENSQPVGLAVRPAPADEPLAMVVIADTANERRWLGTGAKYTDPLQYLREAAATALRDLPENGRYAVYTMNTDGVAPLADRTSALNAAAQLQDRVGQPRLLQRLDEAVAALREAPPEWRRVVLVLSDGNSRFGRPYEALREAALKEHVAVFAVGTIDPGQPYNFLDQLARETGGATWAFEKEKLQPLPASPALLELLSGEAARAVRSAYRVEYQPPNTGRDRRDLAISVRTTGGEARARTSYEARFGTWLSSRALLGGGLLLALVAGCVYVVAGKGPGSRRPVRTDYYLVGRGPTAAHFAEEEYLFTHWRPLGRGGRGYRLPPEDPHYIGISRTHVFIRVKNLRTVRAGGVEQTVGEVEVRAGSRGGRRGINTAYIYNDLTGPRLLSQRPYQLQKGDLLVLQGFVHEQEPAGNDGVPPGVRLELGYVANTDTGGATSIEDDVAPAEGDGGDARHLEPAGTASSPNTGRGMAVVRAAPTVSTMRVLPAPPPMPDDASVPSGAERRG